MQAAEHGATFPAAVKIRQSMTHEQIHDFAVGSEKNKPEHVKKGRLAGSHDGMTITEHHTRHWRR